MEDITKIDERLRNSFKTVKKDMDDIKRDLNKRLSDIEELRKGVEEESKGSANREALERLKRDIEEKIRDIKEELRKGDELREKVKDISKLKIGLVNLEKGKTDKKSFEHVEAELLKLKKELPEELESIKEGSITRKELEDKLNFLKDEVKRRFIEISDSLRNIDTKKSDPSRKIELLQKINELELLIKDRVKDIGKVKERIIEFGDYLESYEDKLGDIDKIKADISTIKGTTVTNEYFEQNVKEIEKDALKLRELLEGLEQRSFDEKEFSKKIRDFERKTGDKLREISSLKDDLEITKSETKEEFNNQISLVNQQTEKIDKLEKKFKDTVAANTALYLELKRVNEAIDEDRRLDISRIKLEKKIQAYRDERVESFRGTLLYVFLGLLSFAVVMYFYMLRSPTVFPGLQGRISLIVIILVVLLIVIFLPYRKIMPILEKIGYSLKRRFRVEKKEKVKEKTIEPKVREKVIKPRVKGEGLFKKINKFLGSLFKRRIKEAKPVKEKVRKVKVEKVPKFVRKKEIDLEYIKKGISFVFQLSLVLFLITLIVKEFKEITFVNLTYFLIFVVIFGVLHSIFPTREEKTGRKNYFMIALLSLVGAVFIYSKTRQLGWLAWLIAIVSGILIALLSVVFLEEEKEDVNEKKVVNNFFKGDRKKASKKELLFKKKGDKGEGS